MNMQEIIKTYNDQFKFIPEIINEHLVKKNFKQVVLCGMGGSHLAAGILKTIEPGIDIYVHRDYDIPPFSKSFLESSLLIASSYSGNTEEVISFYKKTKQLYDLPVLCISLGGELIDLAQKNNDPYILLPQTNFLPRTALGITSIAVASVFKDKNIFYKLQNISLDIDKIYKQAEFLLTNFENKIPIFYASNLNLNLAYNWKIKFNETAKQMAFYNVFPESNHNELEAYEYIQGNQYFMPFLLRDNEDNPRIKKRFDVFEQILKDKNIQYESLDISHLDIYEKVFNLIVLGDFLTAMLADKKNIPGAEVMLIEEFKKKLV